MPIVAAAGPPPPQPGPTPAQVVRPAMAPTPIYAAPVAEYTFSPYHHHHHHHPVATPQAAAAQMFAAAAAHQTGPPPAPQAVYPAQPTAIMTDIYGGHQGGPVLVNPGAVYNMTGHPAAPGGEFCIPMADTKQTSTISRNSHMSSWPENCVMSNSGVNSTCFSSKTTASISSVTSNARAQFKTTNSLNSTQKEIEEKSIAELKERKQEIMLQLEGIVGLEATNHVAEQIANGEDTTKDFDFNSTYSIWTSGANWFNYLQKASEKVYDPSLGYRTRSMGVKQENKEEEFIPFDPPSVSRFGPISRIQQQRSIIRPATAIQVSACNTTDSVTTPTVRRPVPTISPMPQVLYQPGGGYTLGFMTYAPTPLDQLNTVGHGFLDPTHLHMSQLEPSGIRPSDPLTAYDMGAQINHEDRLRQQLNAVRAGIDTMMLDTENPSGPVMICRDPQEFEEIRLKKELSLVIHGIEEKRKELESTQAQSLDENDKELGDFEKNWKFDFDEGEKE